MVGKVNVLGFVWGGEEEGIMRSDLEIVVVVLSV